MSVPIAAAVILMLALARGARMRSAAAVAVTAIAVGELLGWNAAFRLNAEPHRDYAVLDSRPAAPPQALELVERSIGERRHQRRAPARRDHGARRALAEPRDGALLEAVNGYNPLRIGIYDRLVAPGESTLRMELRDFPASFDGYDCALARTLGLEFVVLDRPIEEVPHLARRRSPTCCARVPTSGCTG